MDEVCVLFKLAGMPNDVIKKKVFPLSLKGDALTWYRLCDDMGSIVAFSISKSVEPNEEQKEMTSGFSKVFSSSNEIVGNR